MNNLLYVQLLFSIAALFPLFLVNGQTCTTIGSTTITSMVYNGVEYINITFTINSVTDANMVMTLTNAPHPSPSCYILPQTISYKDAAIQTGLTGNIYMLNSHTDYTQYTLPGQILIGDVSDLQTNTLNINSCGTQYINQQISSWNMAASDTYTKSFQGIDGTVYRNPSSSGIEFLIVFGDPTSTNGAECNHISISYIGIYSLLSDNYIYSTTLSINNGNDTYYGLWNNTSPNFSFGSFNNISIIPVNGLNPFNKYTLIDPNTGGILASNVVSGLSQCLSIDTPGWTRGQTKSDVENCLLGNLGSMSNILKMADGTYFSNTSGFAILSHGNSRFPSFPYGKISYSYANNIMTAQLSVNYKASFTIGPIKTPFIITPAPTNIVPINTSSFIPSPSYITYTPKLKNGMKYIIPQISMEISQSTSIIIPTNVTVIDGKYFITANNTMMLTISEETLVQPAIATNFLMDDTGFMLTPCGQSASCYETHSCMADNITAKILPWNLSDSDISLRMFNGISGTVYNRPNPSKVEMFIVIGDPYSTIGAMCTYITFMNIITMDILGKGTLTVDVSMYGDYNIKSTYQMNISNNVNHSGIDKLTVLSSDGHLDILPYGTPINKISGLPCPNLALPDMIGCWSGGDYLLRGSNLNDMQGCLLSIASHIVGFIKQPGGIDFPNQTIRFRTGTFNDYCPLHITDIYSHYMNNYQYINKTFSASLRNNYKISMTLNALSINELIYATIPPTVSPLPTLSPNASENSNVNSAYLYSCFGSYIVVMLSLLF